MLGSDLRIRRFNAAATELLQMKPAFLGRPIHSIDLPASIRDLEKVLLEVIDRVVTKEIEVHGPDDHWYSPRLNPYRTAGQPD